METLNLNRLKSTFPFSTFLNNFVVNEFLRLSEHVKFEFVSGQPYETYADMRKDYNLYGSIKISTDYSDTSIFGKPEINHMFRAVHDMQHIRFNLDFEPASELAITYKTVQEYRKLRLPQLDIDLLTIEMGGQVLYYMEHNDFPADQREFTKQELIKLGYQII